MIIRRLAMAGLLVCALAAPSVAQVTLSLDAFEDTYVFAGDPNSCFGTAGALNISGQNTTGGPYKSALKFDAVPAVAQFDFAFGTGNWTITSAALKVTEVGNPMWPGFPRGPGSVQFSWLSNDNWSQAVGRPIQPWPASGNQLSYNYLQTLLASTTQAPLGTFSTPGTDGQRSFSFTLAPGFVADFIAGDYVTLLGTAASSTVGFTFNSANYFDIPSRPVLEITANQVPEPSTVVMLGCAAMGLFRRARRSRALASE